MTGSHQCVFQCSGIPQWIAVFALPEKSMFFNMAVTDSDLDPKIRKMAITFYWLCGLWAEHAGMYLKCYWSILNELFRPYYWRANLRYITVQRKKRFCTGSVYSRGRGAGEVWNPSLRITGEGIKTPPHKSVPKFVNFTNVPLTLPCKIISKVWRHIT